MIHWSGLSRFTAQGSECLLTWSNPHTAKHALNARPRIMHASCKSSKFPTIIVYQLIASKQYYMAKILLHASYANVPPWCRPFHIWAPSAQCSVQLLPRRRKQAMVEGGYTGCLDTDLQLGWEASPALVELTKVFLELGARHVASGKLLKTIPSCVYKKNNKFLSSSGARGKCWCWGEKTWTALPLMKSVIIIMHAPPTPYARAY
jgi:hypothetical protein